MLSLLKKIFGTAQSRKLKNYSKIVSDVNRWDEKFKSLSDEELKNKTNEFKERYNQGESLDSLLAEAYAVVKNVCRRLCGHEVHVSGYDQKWDMVPYDVQILGAIALHKGSISEMQTGEGKTLTASMPLYLNALTSKPVLLVTVNDYLAKRDCEWIGTIFKNLGLSVNYLINEIPPHERKEIYKSDIVYGTASEFGFDYLRDHSMALRKEDQVQRGYFFAIIDEVDSILVDEARTPLIISGPSAESKQMYGELKDSVFKIVTVQRDLCNHLASEARKSLEQLGVLDETPQKRKLSKKEEEEKKEAFKKLWLVSKGTPRNKILKRIKEDPDLRAEIDHFETYFYSEQNKEERSKELSNLFIIIDERGNEFELTDKGIQEWGKFDSCDDFIMLDLGYEFAQIDNFDLPLKEKIMKKSNLQQEDAKRKERAHNLRQLFRAHLLMEKDVDYIVAENKIIIIDENTGRPQPGRRFSDGLHQAIEAKENVSIQRETQTYATITLQNFFRMFEKIAGMTGTAITEANEFKEIYKMEVLEIPTYTLCKRKDLDDKIFMTEREKYNAILKEIKEIYEAGRPILIGTESVEISEKLSRILKQNKLPHTVLNAKNNTREAEIIAEAGRRGQITVATNMAGRGTDIKLTQEIKELGGLHVIGTTRHHSRRIDRQLRGRSGRLGDPGSSQFFVSFEDSLMRLFASPRLTSMLQKFRPPEGEPISAKVLNKSIETAQKRIEQRNYTIRKHTLEYDDVMNKQRQEIYSFRSELLHSDDPILLAKEILYNVCDLMANRYIEKNNLDDYKKALIELFPVSFEPNYFSSQNPEEIKQMAADKIIKIFDEKLLLQSEIVNELKDHFETDILKEVIRNLIVRKIDSLWQEHLLAIDHLRSDVHLRVVGQKDPLIEFKHEAFYLFDLFSQKLKIEISKDLFRFEMVSPSQKRMQDMLSKLQLHTQKSFISNEAEEPPQEPRPIISEPRIGRNDDCPCGSGKKHKKCCGKSNKEN